MRRVFIGSVVAVALAGLTGCNGTGGNTIVGTWSKACHLPAGKTLYYDKALALNEDGTYKSVIITSTDNKCTQDKEIYIYSGTYKVGGAAKDSNGKDTTELDVTQTKYVHGDTTSTEVSTDYIMYKFLNNGNLVFANWTDAHSGKSKEDRKNYIDPKDAGYTKQ